MTRTHSENADFARPIIVKALATYPRWTGE